MDRGLLGDRLGAHVYKKRVGLAGRGKRGGARTVLIFKKDEIALFLYGYMKNERSNLTPREEEGLRIFAKAFMRLSAAERSERISSGALVPLELRR